METIEDYLEALASAAPAPGGGSAATIVGAMAAALVAMVARITRTSPKFAAHSKRASELVAFADDLRAEFVAARMLDETAYAEVVSAMALPRATDAEKSDRTARLQAALAGAAAAPLAVSELAVRLLSLARDARAFENHNLMSDVDCAAYFAQATLAASAANVRVNHAFMKDENLIAAQARALAGHERSFAASFAVFEKTTA